MGQTDRCILVWLGPAVGVAISAAGVELRWAPRRAAVWAGIASAEKSFQLVGGRRQGPGPALAGTNGSQRRLTNDRLGHTTPTELQADFLRNPCRE
jgi:hypothetical protein